MPVVINSATDSYVRKCSNCVELKKTDDGRSGYDYECGLLRKTAFSLIPNTVVENDEVSPLCPKKNWTNQPSLIVTRV